MKKVFAPLITLFKIDNKKTFYVVLMFISAAIRNIAILLPPIATSGIIMMITNNNFNGIFSYVIMYMAFYFVYFTTYQVNYYSYGVLADYYHIEIQKLLFNKVATNDEIFSSVSKGKIIETCSQDIRYLVDVVDASVEFVMGILQLIIILVIFMYYNAIIASLVLILDLVYLKLMSNNSKKVSKYYEGTRKYEDKIIDTFTQTLSNLRQVKSLNMMPNLDKNIDKSRNKWRIEYKGKNNSLIRRYCQIPYIVYISKIGLYILLAYLVINNYMTLDKLVLLISYFEMTITYTDSALENLLNLNNYNVRMNRIKQVLDLTEKSELDFGEVDNDYINGTVEFKDVTYKIKNKLILDNVSFKIYPNEINTIVGHSGSGKSTIINLLYRLHRVNKGEILIDNESIYNYSKSVYSHNVSGVYQRPFVFDMSIKENLSLVDSNTKLKLVKELEYMI